MRRTIALAVAAGLLWAASPAARGRPGRPLHPTADPHHLRLGDRSKRRVRCPISRADFAVKEGGKEREVLQAGPATVR